MIFFRNFRYDIKVKFSCPPISLLFMVEIKFLLFIVEMIFLYKNVFDLYLESYLTCIWHHFFSQDLNHIF